MKYVSIPDLIFPRFTRKYIIRLVCVIIAAYLFFAFLCIPLIIKGASMVPTYPALGFNFCWTPMYMFSQPKRQNVVIVRFVGTKIMLLKRIVAFEGETVAFKDGKLYINGSELYEPYVKYPCDWNLPERTVQKGNVYVIGDNRSMPIETHEFGETSIKRIAGGPLW